MAFEIAGRRDARRPAFVLSLAAKKKILGLNAARLYGIDVEAQKKKIEDPGRAAMRIMTAVSARPSDHHAGSNSADRSRGLAVGCATVTDPELDESVTELNFVTNVDVDADRPRPHRLPSADLLVRRQFRVHDGGRHARGRERAALGRGVSVVLGEHMYADKINRGSRAACRSRRPSATRRREI